MRKFENPRKKNFLTNLPRISLDDDSNDLTIRCKFNFSYFDSSQDAGQDFKDWKLSQLIELLNKLRDFSRKPLFYWQNERCGGGGLKVLEIYGSFPNKSKFVHPKFVPHQVKWGRFRLGSKIRLAGFTIPTELHGRQHQKTCVFFDQNTFYIVFFDQDHKFYLSEQK